MNKRSALMMTGLLLIIGLAALLSSTFAWIDVSRVPFVTDVNITVMAESAMRIAPDLDGSYGEWADILDASQIIDGPVRPAIHTPKGFVEITYDNNGRANGAKATDDVLYFDFWLISDSPANVKLDPQFNNELLKIGLEINDRFISNDLFHISMNQPLKVRMYLWLDGDKVYAEDIDGVISGFIKFEAYDTFEQEIEIERVSLH